MFVVCIWVLLMIVHNSRKVTQFLGKSREMSDRFFKINDISLMAHHRGFWCVGSQNRDRTVINWPFLKSNNGIQMAIQLCYILVTRIYLSPICDQRWRVTTMSYAWRIHLVCTSTVTASWCPYLWKNIAGDRLWSNHLAGPSPKPPPPPPPPPSPPPCLSLPLSPTISITRANK